MPGQITVLDCQVASTLRGGHSSASGHRIRRACQLRCSFSSPPTPPNMLDTTTEIALPLGSFRSNKEPAVYSQTNAVHDEKIDKNKSTNTAQKDRLGTVNLRRRNKNETVDRANVLVILFVK